MTGDTQADVGGRDEQPTTRSVSIPGTGPHQIEMRIRLSDGREVTVVEHAEQTSDLAEALERARVRLAMGLARGLVDGFVPGGRPRIPAAG